VRTGSQSLNTLERRALSGLAAVFGVRMLGLFMILPVFSPYAVQLKGHSAFLVGVALGAYGLTQAIFQIPLGMLSDRLGRKPVIVCGLLLFFLGSVVAASADTIMGVIIGRALQGAGAIAAAVIAMLADLTRDEQRTKAMLLIGITIGATFVVSLLLGPVLDGAIGVRGIFWLTAALALVAVTLVLAAVPTPVRSTHHLDAEPVPTQFLAVLRNKELLRLDLGIFVLHMVLTALFVVVPIALLHYAGLPVREHWHVYLPAMILSLFVVLPAVNIGERRRKLRNVFLAAVLVLMASQLVLFKGYQSFIWLAGALFLFFTGFNMLEALLPSLISKIAPVDSKGTAIGVYSTFEFFGAFVGGTAGGYLLGQYGMASVFAFTGGLLMVWVMVAATMPEPRMVATRLLHVGRQQPAAARELARKLTNITGVVEAIVIAEEGVAYVKVDSSTLDEEALQRFGRPR
jgi:MFS family permease